MTSHAPAEMTSDEPTSLERVSLAAQTHADRDQRAARRAPDGGDDAAASWHARGLLAGDTLARGFGAKCFELALAEMLEEHWIHRGPPLRIVTSVYRTPVTVTCLALTVVMLR